MVDVPKDNDALRQKYWDDKRVEFEQGCNQGNAGACFSLGEWYQLLQRDLTKAAEIFEETCEKKQHGNSCFSLAQLYKGRVLGKDEAEQKAKSFELTDRACEYGNSQACSAIASHYLYGFGCAKDVPKAQKLFENACEENDPIACFKLGRLFLDGERKHHVPRDAPRAFTHMKKACDLGHPNGCQVLAVMYRKGDGVKKDMKLFDHYRQLTLDIVKQTGERMGAEVV
ncbi:Cytochrome c oxidase assembly factor 7-like [Hondaea fermentalgiana]|uniref:Cytochrome c oxidase assembly factor 7-like n=1 Tax=Hondaea fermentalgiana TaxID=2315210 RepID=A0A2R5G4E9_9STRA|nr:Cytochrome c oxidase assembly factor 7-like [Hondaea fermentalgiana]|eukprot:GBG25897.1 Cytochrome c oxidase assembly factor 7-like [Hondaea fermentalgiana]